VFLCPALFAQLVRGFIYLLFIFFIVFLNFFLCAETISVITNDGRNIVVCYMILVQCTLNLMNEVLIVYTIFGFSSRES
jgi:hypothetical protein